MPILTRHQIAGAARWAIDGRLLARDFDLARLMASRASEMPAVLKDATLGELTLENEVHP